MLPVSLVEGEKVVGAAVSDRVVIFSRNGRTLSEDFSFKIPKSVGKSAKVLLTDLSEGQWTVMKDNKVLEGSKQVTKEAGTIYFNAGPGVYTIVR